MKKYIGEILVEMGYIDQDQLDMALMENKKSLPQTPARPVQRNRTIGQSKRTAFDPRRTFFLRATIRSELDDPTYLTKTLCKCLHT